MHSPHPKSTKGETKGGIVYFIHSSIPSSDYECLPDLGISTASTSAQTVYLRIDIGGRRLVIGWLYLHPTHTGGKGLVESIEKASYCAVEREYMILCGGDLNLHIQEYGDRTGKIDLLSEMLVDTIDDSDMRCLNNVYDRDHCTYP